MRPGLTHLCHFCALQVRNPADLNDAVCIAPDPQPCDEGCTCFNLLTGREIGLRLAELSVAIHKLREAQAHILAHLLKPLGEEP